MEQFNYVQGPALPHKRSPRWPWFLAAGSVVVPLILLFGIATVNESIKVNRLTSIADGIPSRDWKLLGRDDPRHDITCIPFDHSCHDLYRAWETPVPLSLPELVASTGYDLEIGTVYRPDSADGYKNKISIRLCIDENQVSLNMHD